MTAIDPGSPTWIAVKKWAAERIEDARNQLEHGASPGGFDDRARGGIAALRELLALERPAVLTPPSVDYLHEVKRG